MLKEHTAFTVVIPLYNKRHFVRRSVESALGQTYPHFVVVVVDDGSSDGSCDTLEGLDDPRLQIIRQENRGVGAARNRGAEAGSEAWIAFLDADDMWFPDHLEVLVELALRYPDAALLSARSLEVRSNDELMRLTDARGPGRSTMIDYFLEASREIGILNSSSTAVRRDAFSALGGFGAARAGEDLEYWARVALRYPVARSTKATSVYFRDTGGVMQALSTTPGERATVGSLRDVSPSVRMLCEANDADPQVFESSSVRAYVNSRVYSLVRGALYRGDVAGARASIDLGVEPYDTRMRALRRALGAPIPFIQAGLAAYRSVRRIKG